MSESNATSVLFTGYAPVHFVCFQPLYKRLAELPSFDVHVSGGLRTKAETGYTYDEEAMYRPFSVPRDRILSVDDIREREFDVLITANTKAVRPRKVGTRIQIFHGISFRNRAIRSENLGCDHYFVVGPYMHRKFREAGLFNEDDARAVKVGFPKTDPLLNGEYDRAELMAQFGFDGRRPMLLYAPTGEKHNSLETMGEEVIRRLIQSGRYDILIKPHDHPKDQSVNWFSRLTDFEDAHTRIVRGFDVTPLLFLADLLITDASSVSSEFSLLDRPIVFLDVPMLLARSLQRKDSMVDIDTWGRHTGVVVKKPDHVLEAIESSLANPSQRSDVRKAMAKDLFYNPGRATDAAVTWLTETFSTCTAQLPRAS